MKIAKRLSAIFLLTFATYASFPWKLNRYSYGVQFGINDCGVYYKMTNERDHNCHGHKEPE